ncbi:MAG: hypothetical protein U0R64_08615 [Candidatus Nanopelagicales bacterium]
MTVAIVTCLTMPEPDVDADVLMDALAAAGVGAELVAWDDLGVDWSVYGCAVVRSAWNYIDHLDAFNAWAARAGEATSLFNPAPVITWNTHKGYLRELADQGVDVVPTAWVRAGSRTTLAHIMDDNIWSDVVAKPVVGAGSYLTERIRDPESSEALAFWDRLVGERDAMVQPYLASVEEYGERSLVWIDGALTHSVRKSPRLGDDPESVSEALPIADDERELAETVMADIPHELLYARIDLIRDAFGRPLLAELELVEPSLFLRQSDHALRRLVRGIAARA